MLLNIIIILSRLEKIYLNIYWLNKISFRLFLLNCPSKWCWQQQWQQFSPLLMSVWKWIVRKKSKQNKSIMVWHFRMFVKKWLFAHHESHGVYEQRQTQSQFFFDGSKCVKLGNLRKKVSFWIIPNKLFGKFSTKCF